MKSYLYKLVRLSDGMIVAEGAKRTMLRAVKVAGHAMFQGSPASQLGNQIDGQLHAHLVNRYNIRNNANLQPTSIKSL